MSDSIERRKPHPYAEIFPPMDDDAFTKFKANIAVRGQQVAILLYQDQILDGRMREEACAQLGILPICVPADVKNDEAALELVMSLNEHRRHLSFEQSAFAAARYANVKESGGAPKGNKNAIKKTTGSQDPVVSPDRTKNDPSVTVSEAAKRFKVSTATVKRARRVIKSGDKDLEQAVLSKKKGLTKAAAEVKSCGSIRKPDPKKKPTLYQQLKANPLPPLKALTPEEVDPDFKGTPHEYTMKYGHVRLESAAATAAHESLIRCDTLFSALRDFKAKMPVEPITIEEVEAWLKNYSKKPNERDARRAALRELLTVLMDACNRLMPLVPELSRPVSEWLGVVQAQTESPPPP